MAWLGLGWPGLIERRAGLICGLLAAGLPASLIGLSGMAGLRIAVERHEVEWIDGLAPASASFGLLSLFFLIALLIRRAPPPSGEAPAHRLPMPLGFAALLVALAGLAVPLAYLLAATGYADRLRERQAAEAHAFASTAFRAVQVYWIEHQGAQPPDNRSAGLASAENMRGRYVQSVRIDGGAITLSYRDDPVAHWLGASTTGVVLRFTAADPSRPNTLDENGSHWACKATGFRGPHDGPIYFGDACWQ